MSGEYPRGMVEFFEDFLVDNGSGSSGMTEAASGAAWDILDRHGGWFRSTGSTGQGDYSVITTELAWEVDEGHPLVLEVRLRCSDVSVSSIFVGFTDDVDDTGPAIEDEDGTLGGNAADAFGFLLEGEQDETWQAVGVDTSTYKTQYALTKAADAADNVIQTLRLEANPNDSGTVKFFIDGELVGTRTNWFDSSILYCAAVSTDGRGTASNLDVDYVYVSAPRS